MPDSKVLRPKLIVVGHARHGKDTFCERLETFGYKWVSSSWAAGEIAVWPHMKDQYPDFQACFADRGNHRDFWFNAIRDYNTPDLSRLAREIFTTSDIYCGMRRKEELSACKEQKVCHFVIFIDAALRLPLEPKTSMTVEAWQANHVMTNNGTLEEFHQKIDKFYNGFLRHWEDRMNNPEPALPNHATRTTP